MPNRIRRWVRPTQIVLVWVADQAACRRLYVESVFGEQRGLTIPPTENVDRSLHQSDRVAQPPAHRRDKHRQRHACSAFAMRDAVNEAILRIAELVWLVDSSRVVADAEFRLQNGHQRGHAENGL